MGLLLVHWKSPLDFVVQPKMPGQALENHWKNTVVKKQKNMYSAYPQSDGVCSESAWKSSGSVKTSNIDSKSSHDISVLCEILSVVFLPTLVMSAVKSLVVAMVRGIIECG